MANFRMSLPYTAAWIPYPEEIQNNENYSNEVKKRAVEARRQKYQRSLEGRTTCCRICQYESDLSRWIAETTYGLSHFGIILRCPGCEIAVYKPPG